MGFWIIAENKLCDEQKFKILTGFVFYEIVNEIARSEKLLLGYKQTTWWLHDLKLQQITSAKS